MGATDVPTLGMILKGYPRISETFISNEVLLLERLGFSIHIFSMRQPRESFTHESVQQIQAGVDYLPETLFAPLPRFLYHAVVLAIKRPGRYWQTLAMAVARCLRTRRVATVKHFLQACYLVHHLMPRKRIVHLHAHFAHSPTSVALFASRLSDLPFSFTAHAKDIYTSEPRQLAEKIRWARFAITCTEHNRRYLSQLSDAAATPIHCIYHGIDTALFSSHLDRPAPAAEPYTILTVARLTAKKGLPTLYRALQRLRERGVSFRHTLIGDGDDRERILSLIADLGLGDVTEWLGTQPHHVVLDHYRQADLFVLACEVAADGDRDGIPNVCMESMAMGVPVVTTHVSAIPELLVSEETGLLVSPGDPAALADAMFRMLTDAELRRRVIPAARECVGRDFDNKRLTRALAQIYDEAIPELNAAAAMRG
jgi:glycosyltransferase involved in cell wall biosynthesis